MKKANMFSSDSFFNSKNKAIREYIFKTYRNIQSLENAMGSSSLPDRQFKIASQLDFRFTKEILGKNPEQQMLIESYQVRNALNTVFKGHFGLFKNILENVDDAIDEFDGVSTEAFQTKLQSILPKLANIGNNGMVFTFDDGLLKMGMGNNDLVSLQIEQKSKELEILKEKQKKIKEFNQ